jgi:hypothetical protein
MVCFAYFLPLCRVQMLSTLQYVTIQLLQSTLWTRVRHIFCRQLHGTDVAFMRVWISHRRTNTGVTLKTDSSNILMITWPSTSHRRLSITHYLISFHGAIFLEKLTVTQLVMNVTLKNLNHPTHIARATIYIRIRNSNTCMWRNVNCTFSDMKIHQRLPNVFTIRNERQISLHIFVSC